MPTIRAAATASAIILTSCVGYSGLFGMPMWVGPVAGALGLSALAVGAIASAQISAATLASFVASRLVRAERIRKGAAAGLILIGIANLVSAVVTGAATLLVARLGSGLGEGLVLAFANASIASTATADRYFAWSQIGLGLFGLILFAAVPAMLSHFGANGVFLLVGVAALVSATLVVYLPTGVQRSGAPIAGASGFRNGTLWRALSGLAIIFIGCQGAWAFLERAGFAKGFPSARVARYLVVGQVLGLCGPLLARAVGRRRAWSAGVTLGLAISALAVLSATQPVPPSLFVLATSVFQLGTLCIVTSYLTYLALSDDSGRSAAAAPSAINLGCAIGPVTVGLVWKLGGSAITGWAIVFSYAIGLALLLSGDRPRISRKLRRRDRG
jgi:predicted MFS family arabinose efflux permease